MNGKEVFPLLALGDVLCDFGVEFFWDAVEGEAVVCGEDELLFEPEAFLEFFDLGEKADNLGGDVVNKFRRFNPIITIVKYPPPAKLTLVSIKPDNGMTSFLM